MSIDAVLTHLTATNLASRIWRREPEAFVGPDPAPATHASITNRLGWLDAPSGMPARLAEVDAFADALAADGLTDVYLLGMGGSSLCAEVLRDVLGRSGRALVVLDTTDERAVMSATADLSPSRACFLVASKSGSTIEVTALERHFWSVMAAAVPSPGRHFVAITDPGTELVTHARNLGYRHTFINPPDIGGRYSALSLFGLVPARLVGISGPALLAPAQAMADRCRLDDAANPGLVLGAFMGGHAQAGRDKLTILAPASLAPLGAWIEQLVAESTGKLGRGILPIVGEPIGGTPEYGPDRAFVALLTPDDTNVREAADALEAAGHPVLGIETSPEALGAEFFRWEFATAVAGAVLALNPFDEPDVRGAKVRTQAQLDAQRTTGAFRIEPPFSQGQGYSRRDLGPTAPASGRPYLAILDYLPADPARAAAIEKVRGTVRQRRGIATTYGIGPRYLHSTGQYHKGGPNSGVFLLITSADDTSTQVPGMSFTFSVLKHAQAFGDVDALAHAGRRVIHLHVDDPRADIATDIERVLLALA